MNGPPVQFDNVSKKFRRGQLHDSLRDTLAAGMARLTGCQRGRSAASTIWALRDVSFAAEQGEALGIIGTNGAGKSTSLKLLAGILRPDGGSLAVRGRLAALIEVSAGLHGDLTGRENIYLSGAILGMSAAEVRGRLDAIVAFSGLHEFLDTPVKRFSTGMTARLGFSVAAHVDPDVLLVDEVLSVGDVAFRQRCDARMRELVARGTTLIFVTHNLEQMRSICHRAAVLDKGQLTFLGDPSEASRHYLEAVMLSGGALYADCPQRSRNGDGVSHFRLLDADGRETGIVRSTDPLTMEVCLHLARPITRLSAEVTIRRLSGDLFVNFNSAREAHWYEAPAGGSRLRVSLPSLPLAGGSYVASVRLWDADACKVLAESPPKYSFVIDDNGRPTGVLALPSEWPTRVEPLAEAATDSCDGWAQPVAVIT
jgi:ABC-type polysaccharide/polyol phosphate transport system ATPase subunit